MADDELKNDGGQAPESEDELQSPVDDQDAGQPDAEPEVEPNAEPDAGSGEEPSAEDPVDEAGDQPEEDEYLEPEVAFSWQASEFVHHHKSPVWYAILAMGIIVLTAMAVWLHLWLEIGVFLAMGAAVVVYARKPPRTLLYELDQNGIKIDAKSYPFADFRSFGVAEDEEWHSIDLEPTKRFSLRLVLLFDSTNYDEIVDHLERHLPREDRELGVVERITRFVRF